MGTSNKTTPPDQMSGRLPRTKEGRPALRLNLQNNDCVSTSWMAVDHGDRGSLTFADVPAYTPFIKKGEQQWRL